MSSIEGKGVVCWAHPRFAQCVATWEAVRRLDDWPYNLYDLRLWREVLELAGDPSINVDASVDWLQHHSWERGHNVAEVFAAWRAGVTT